MINYRSEVGPCFAASILQLLPLSVVLGHLRSKPHLTQLRGLCCSFFKVMRKKTLTMGILQVLQYIPGLWCIAKESSVPLRSKVTEGWLISPSCRLGHEPLLLACENWWCAVLVGLPGPTTSPEFACSYKNMLSILTSLIPVFESRLFREAIYGNKPSLKNLQVFQKGP